MGRAPCCDKANVKKGPWSPEEDAKLKSYIEQHGTGGNWIALPQKIGLKRCGKSCRLRWLNYLRPNIKHGGFSEEEDNIICSLYISIGSRWSIIAAQLPGRTDNDIKNYWNTRLKKKLFGKQRKDHHQQNRRVGGLKQEVKRDDQIGNLDNTYNGVCWSTYRPQPPMPMYLTGRTDHLPDDEQASMGKLLANLVLGVSHGSSPALPTSVLPRLVYDDSPSLVSPPVPASSCGESSEGPSFSTELDEMFRFNPVKLEGLDNLYGMAGMVNESNGIITSLENMNWNDVSTVMFPNNMIQSTYQGIQQCPFEEPAHLGM